MKSSKREENPLFAIAADNWRNQIMTLNKYGVHKTSQGIVRRLIREFGHKRVGSITKEDIQRYVVKLNATSGLVNIKHHLSLFKGIMEHANEDWEMPRKLKFPKGGKPRQEMYSFEEVRRILNSCSDPLRSFVMLLAETGCRLGEGLALKSKDLYPDKIRIDKNVYEGVLQPTPKTESSNRVVCISPTLYENLKPLKSNNPEDFLFRGTFGRPLWPQKLMYALREACKQAGVDYKAFHSFRRGNVTELVVRLQVPEKIVAARIGHLCSSLILGVYCQILPEEEIVWLPKIEKWLYKGLKE